MKYSDNTTFKKAARMKNMYFQDSAMLSVVGNIVTEWRSEMCFLQNKSSSLIKIITASNFSKKCTGGDGNDVRKEFSKMMSHGFPPFRKKLEAYATELESVNFSPEGSLESCILYYNEIRENWQNLRKRYWQLEMQILDASIKNYPVTIF